MRASYVITLLIASATAAWSQTVYYATFTGENYATQTWLSSSLAAFKAAPPDDVYDSYTVERHSDGYDSRTSRLHDPIRRLAI